MPRARLALLALFAPLALAACDSNDVDGGLLLADTGSSGDSGTIDNDGGPSPDAAPSDADGGTNLPDTGGGMDAEPGDAGPQPDVGYARCMNGRTGFDGLLNGNFIEYTTGSGRSGAGSSRMGDLGLARWFNNGLLYISSATPLNATSQAASLVLRMPDDAPSPGNFYCARVGSATFSEPALNDFRIEAELEDLLGVGSCPGGTATADTLTLCSSDPVQRACTSSTATNLVNLLSGRLDGTYFEQPADVVAIRIDSAMNRVDSLFAGGRGLSRLTQNAGGQLSGYLLWRGPGALDPPTVYCVTRATRSGTLPTTIIEIEAMTRLPACPVISGTSGSLSLCNE